MGRTIKKWNAFELKLFMALLMVLDHLEHIPGLLSPQLAGIFHVLTRCVGAWFAYSAVEGFCYTHDRVRYNARLFVWALGMAAGNRLYDLLGAAKGLTLSNNIFLTLALGVLSLNVLAGTGRGRRAAVPAGEKLLRALGAAAVAVAGMLFAEGGTVLLPFMLITYACRDRKGLRDLLYLALSLLLLWMVYQPYPTPYETLMMLAFNADFLFITVLPFLAVYNGERGPKGKFSKYFFYIFYPLHLWLIGLAALLAA